jgi:hypothetical protein
MGRRARTGSLSPRALTAARTQIERAIAAGALLVALGCGGSLTSNDGAGRLDDAGALGQGGASGAAGVSGSAGGGFVGAGGRAGAGGGAGAAVDAGSEQGSCRAMCGFVGGVVAPSADACTFTVPCPAIGDFIRLAVFVDARQVPTDPTHTEGWAYTDGSMSAFTLYGQACLDAQAGALVDISYLCQLP